MSYDIFVSYSSKDETAAEAARTILELNQLRCWIAPRDIRPGADWTAEIVHGIEASRVMLVLLSKNSNTSPQVQREIARAVGKGITVLPVQLEQIILQPSLEYLIGMVQRLDVSGASKEQRFKNLVPAVKKLLETPDTELQSGKGSASDQPRRAAEFSGIARGNEGKKEFRYDNTPGQIPTVGSPSSASKKESDERSDGSGKEAGSGESMSPDSASLFGDVLSIGREFWSIGWKLFLIAIVGALIWNFAFVEDFGVSSDDFIQRGSALYKANNAKGAFELFSTAAKRGNATGQMLVGSMYLFGDGIQKDIPSALKYLQLSANQGNSAAQLKLGEMAEKGIGTPQDMAAAKLWYQKAADNGDADAKQALQRILEK